MGKGTKGRKGKNKEENSNKNQKRSKKNIQMKKPKINKKDEKDDKSDDSLKSVSKKVAISYKRMKENHQTIENKYINKLSLEELKSIASNFDLDPLINFRLLSLLKKNKNSEYKKYITKYKYTLNYEDAKKLNCFNDDENKIKEEHEKNFKEKINNIKSLAKLKLFNFLFFLMKFQYSDLVIKEQQKTTKEIKDALKFYDSEVDLVFKVPNNFGNYELQYYTYLSLFILHFQECITPKNDNEINSNDVNENFESLENGIYFDWDKNSNGGVEEVDMSIFEEKKNNLKDFINKYLEKNVTVSDNNNHMEVEKNDYKSEINKTSIHEEKRKNGDDLTERVTLSKFLKQHVPKLKIYKTELYYLFKQDDDEKIIEQIEFIFCSLIFRDGNSDLNHICYDIYPNCLYNDPKKKNEDLYITFTNYSNEDIRNTINKDELVFANVDDDFPQVIDNPFANRAKYYKYPKNLEKNIFKENERTKKFFRNFLKEVYQSPLLEEIFYLTPEFNDFKYPLKDEEILNEMIDNTLIIPFGNENLHGYTQKLFAKVYISNNLINNRYNKNDITDIIIKIGFTLNTMIHEQLKHYLKGLLFYNSFRYKINKRLDSDLSGYNQEKFFMDNIRKIFLPNNKISPYNPLIDGGFRAEIYLYGYALHHLSYNEAIRMFTKSSWDISVLEHLKQFNQNNKLINKNEYYSINDIKENKVFNDFIKEVFILFGQSYKIDKIKINYNKMGSEKSKDNLSDLDGDRILVDYRTVLTQNIIRKPDTKTDRRYLYLFNMTEDY